MREEAGTENAYESNSLPLREDLAARRFELQHESYYDQFLDDLCRMGTMSRELAETASTSVLCTFDQQLRAGNVADPDSRLPVGLRQLLVGCERRGESPPLVFDRDEFLATIADDLNVSEARAEQLIKAVFAAVRRQLSHDETLNVAAKLPPTIQKLWL